MKDETRERRRNLLWGLPASLILHALIAALVVYSLPKPPQQPQQEQAVNVALVPPPDQPKPKPAPAPPPKNPKAEKPPEPKVEKPPEQDVEKPPPPEKQPRKPSPIEVLKPVFQFGDKDTGPRKSLDGASAQDNSPSPAKDEDAKPPVEPKPPENQPAAPADAVERPAKVGEKPGTAAKDAEPAQDAEKQQADRQEAGAHDADKQPAAPETPLTAAGGDGEIELPTSAEAPKPKPADAPNPGPAKVSKSRSGGTERPGSTDAAVAASRSYSGLPGVRRLYSQGATGDALATTSMTDVPRGQRAATLCASALQQQLLDASYFPDLIPSVRLKAGNVLDAPDVAFRATTGWYHLSFRCEVDTDATRVLSFNFRVGPTIPPNEWARLGLPTR
ncbi:DUF930 domain-containing protein [Mesorhizobium calcicola]|uniref:DUF930 domain-containing protein n=1 Tax=Mesorhizobium calcicola TaxID=1300310 RepID=A0ABW4WDP5_9HYPH